MLCVCGCVFVVVVEVGQGTLGVDGRGGEGADIKSNNLHLTGEEKQSPETVSFVRFQHLLQD